MSVVKRPNSKFWYVQFQFNGESYIKSSKTTNKKIAEKFEIDLKAKVHSEKFLGKKQRIKFQAAFSQYKESKKGIASFANLSAHENVLKRLLPFHKYLDEFTTHDLEKFKRDRIAEGAGAEIIKYGFLLFRGTWKYAKKLGYMVNELDFPQVKMPKSSLRYLSQAEEERLLIELDPYREGQGLPSLSMRSDELKRAMQDAYDLVILLLDTGARYSEIANIPWRKINLKDRSINLWRSKVENETTLYMTDRVFAVLSRRAEDQSTEHVFNNKTGDSRGYCTQSIRKALKRAGLVNCRVHTLRHTLASRLIQNGMSVYEVRDILGHSDIKTTMRYAHLEQHHVTSKARDIINKLNQNSAEQVL